MWWPIVHNYFLNKVFVFHDKQSVLHCVLTPFCEISLLQFWSPMTMFLTWTDHCRPGTPCKNCSRIAITIWPLMIKCSFATEYIQPQVGCGRDVTSESSLTSIVSAIWIYFAAKVYKASSILCNIFKNNNIVNEHAYIYWFIKNHLKKI